MTGFLGVTVVEIWDQLRPYIEYERKRRHRELYLEYFENLAVQVRELDVYEVRRRLRKWDEFNRSGQGS